MEYNDQKLFVSGIHHLQTNGDCNERPLKTNHQRTDEIIDDGEINPTVAPQHVTYAIDLKQQKKMNDTYEMTTKTNQYIAELQLALISLDLCFFCIFFCFYGSLCSYTHCICMHVFV